VDDHLRKWHFEFDSLKPGKFSLQGAKRGFISAAYDQHEQFSTAIVTGVGFDTENLALRLTPLAQLGGKVIDESAIPSAMHVSCSTLKTTGLA